MPRPAILESVQRLAALDRNAERVAHEIVRLVGKPGELRDSDVQWLCFG